MSHAEETAASLAGGAPLLAFRAAGLRVGVRSEAAGLVERVRAQLVPGWEECEAVRLDQLWDVREDDGRWTLEHRGEVIARAGSDAEILAELDRWLPLGIGAEARGVVFVHAGAVGWAGRGLVLPGATFAGKSTLVKALVDAGARYYSDEFAVLDGDGLLHAYPRPLGLREPQGGKRCFDARELGWSEAFEPLPVALVATLRHRAGARLALTPTSPGHGSLALLGNTVSARTQPQAALACAARVAADARFLEGERGEAGEAATALLAALEGAAS